MTDLDKLTALAKAAIEVGSDLMARGVPMKDWGVWKEYYDEVNPETVLELIAKAKERDKVRDLLWLAVGQSKLSVVGSTEALIAHTQKLEVRVQELEDLRDKLVSEKQLNQIVMDPRQGVFK